MKDDNAPNKWRLATFESLNHYYSSNINPAEYPEEVFELYSVTNFPFGEPELQNGSAIGSTKQRIQPDDVLLCKINPRINRVWKVLPKGAHTQISSSEWIVFRSPLLHADFFKYYFQSPKFRQQLCEDVTGVGGSLTRAQPRKVAQFLLPVPPLNEQIQIANRLDSLFFELNAAREQLDQVPELIKEFRKTVIEIAMNGELTKDWRDGKQANWIEIPLKEIVFARLGKMLDKSKNTGVPTPYLRNLNVRWFHFDLVNIAEILAEDYELGELYLRKEDVLVCEGGEPGRCAVWNGIENHYIFQKALHRLRVKPGLNPHWLTYCLKNAADSGVLDDYYTGSTIRHLTSESLAVFPVLLPGIEEQEELVLRVQSLFASANDLEERYKSVISSLNTLESELLEQAFMGKFIAQNLENEPVSEVLNRIHDLREAEKIERSGVNKTQRSRKPIVEETTNSVDQLLEHLRNIGGMASPEQLLTAAGLRHPEGIEHFYDLLREGHKAHKFDIETYENGSLISELQNEN